MPHVDGFPDRDGLKKLLTLAKAMCATVATFSALILKKYPDNELIAGLLTAIAAVCSLIPELEGSLDFTEGENDVPTETPELTPGLDSGALPAGDPSDT